MSSLAIVHTHSCLLDVASFEVKDLAVPSMYAHIHTVDKEVMTAVEEEGGSDGAKEKDGCV